MEKILVIRSSIIEKEKSFSFQLTNLFLEKYQELKKDVEIIELDLNDVEMAQKTLTVHNMPTYFNEKDSDFYINQLKNVDKIIVTSQMTNFGITGILKNYLDHICVANKTFSYKYSKKGDAIGLLNKETKVMILATQGAPFGWYPWGDHVANLKGTLEFLGLTVFDTMLVSGTKLTDATEQDPTKFINNLKAQIFEKADSFSKA